MGFNAFFLVAFRMLVSRGVGSDAFISFIFWRVWCVVFELNAVCELMKGISNVFCFVVGFYSFSSSLTSITCLNDLGQQSIGFRDRVLFSE